MTTGVALSGAAREATTAALEWRLIGLLLERPRPGWLDEIDRLGAETSDGDLRAAAVAARQASEGEYLAVLGPGGFLSAREIAYRGRQDPGQILADVRGFYDAFAYRPSAAEPADHVAVEAGFVGYLRLKQALALARQNGEEARIVEAAAERFVEDHVRFVAATLASRLEATEVTHLVRAARALASRCGPAPANAAPTGADDVDDGGLECGGCGVDPIAFRRGMTS